MTKAEPAAAAVRLKRTWPAIVPLTLRADELKYAGETKVTVGAARIVALNPKSS